MSLYKIKDFDTNYHQQNSEEHIKGFDLYLKNEKIGSADDLLVDDDGHIRYLVINTEIWMFGKKVLLPVGCSQVDYNAHCVYALNLTKAQLEVLPAFTEGMTVDFDYEDRVRQVYRSSTPLSMFASSGVGYAGSETAPPTPIELPTASGVGYDGSETSPPGSIEPALPAGVGYAGYGTEPPAPAEIPTSYGVGYGGYEPAPAVLSPDPNSGAAAGRDSLYPYHQAPDLYEITEQNHQWLKRHEAQLVARKKQHNLGRSL